MNYFKETFSTQELQDKCRSLYECYINQNNMFEVRFKELFCIDYSLVFGDQNYKMSMLDLLSSFYRNEFFIKYKFMTKVLLERKTSISGLELPLLNSRADIVSINGKSIAYEIKTEYDTTARLLSQIEDYSKCFEYVYVICSKTQLKKVKTLLPDYCGIYVYQNRKNLNFIRYKDASFSPNLNAYDILKCFTKTELINSFGISDAEIIFNRFSLTDVSLELKKSLKDKYFKRWENYKKNYITKDY